MSRLARNNRAWHPLIDRCALTDTLRIADDGVYDPRQLNDRFVLGMQGALAEYALGLMRQRARTAFEENIRRGHVMWEVPVGGVRTDDHRREKSAARQVQQAVTGVCRTCRALGSARQTMLWYREGQLPRPEGQPGTAGRARFWRLPSGHRLHQRLIHPAYAGALASGRTEAKTVLEAGRARPRTRRKKPREPWRSLRRDNHAGSISGEEFLGNQQTVEANRHMPQEGAGGASGGIDIKLTE